MKIARTACAAAVATCLLLSAAGAAVAAPAAAPGLQAGAGHDTQADSQLNRLIAKVKQAARDKDPAATDFMLAAGTAPGGPTTDMTQVTDWCFVVNTSNGHAVEVQARLDGTITSVTERAGHWSGVTPITGLPKLTLADADQYLRQAGHTEGFQYVSLVEPLTASPYLQYHFENGYSGSGDGYAVNADTGTVTPIW